MKCAAALLLVALAAAGVRVAHGLGQGAPPSACRSLLPHHTTDAHTQSPAGPQAAASPFFVAATRGAPDAPLRVHIASREGFAYKGFILQARAEGSDEPLGTFTVGEPYKIVDCGSGSASTVTHTNAALKNESVFEWTPPAGFSGVVVMNATIVQDYVTFWNNVTARVQLGGGGAGISTTQLPRTTVRTSTTAAPATRPPVASRAEVHPIYQGCKDTKACFGLPAGCDISKSCTIMASVLARAGKYDFEMLLENGAEQYIAVGLSDDETMGDDLVTECLLYNNRVQGFQSWNIGKRNNRERAIDLKNSSFTNGILYCKYELDAIVQANGKDFDLTKSYFLLLARGPTNEQNIRYHSQKTASKQSDYLTNVNGFSPASKLLIRLHGAFMIGAWIGAASIGIVLARYFKQTWSGHQLCGKDLWFAWHRMLMLLVWCLTIAGFVLIFIELKAWSQVENPHAYFGVVTTALAFFQPIFAAFRPHPDSRRRPIFNWLHWLIGNCAHILAIVSIFLAGQLGKAELPKWWIWIMVAYVAFHVLMHLILSVAGCISERQNGKKINSFPMREMTNSRTPLASADRKQEAPHSCFRKFLLALYILGILALTIAIIVIVALAPIEDSWEQFKVQLTGSNDSASFP